jgi:hypothetical protein
MYPPLLKNPTNGVVNELSVKISVDGAVKLVTLQFVYNVVNTGSTAVHIPPEQDDDTVAINQL